MSPLALDPPSPDEVVEALRAIVNRWSDDYHCCPENKHGATHGAGCPLVAGLLMLARIRKPENEESGRPVSESVPGQAQVFGAFDRVLGLEGPDITISGRPEGDPLAEELGAAFGDLDHPAITRRPIEPLVTSDELARRDGPPRAGRGAEFPRDDGTYVVEVIPAPPRAPSAADCLSCDGRGVIFEYVDPRTTTEKRFFACKACDGTGRRKENRHV